MFPPEEPLDRPEELGGRAEGGEEKLRGIVRGGEAENERLREAGAGRRKGEILRPLELPPK
jgi:hypothetical protein